MYLAFKVTMVFILHNQVFTRKRRITSSGHSTVYTDVEILWHHQDTHLKVV